MGLTTVLTHQGRVLAKVPTGASVEGTRQYGTVAGPWFKCRLFPDETPETDSGARGGRRMLVKGPHIVCGVRDKLGGAINPGDISPAVQVEVDAGMLGTQVWQVTSSPQPLLTRKKNLGFYFTIRRVETAGADTGGY